MTAAANRIITICNSAQYNPISLGFAACLLAVMQR